MNRTAAIESNRQRAIAARNADRILASAIIASAQKSPVVSPVSRIVTGAIRFVGNHR